MVTRVPGRPFFMTTGVSMTSSAPWARASSAVWARSCGGGIVDGGFKDADNLSGINGFAEGQAEDVGEGGWISGSCTIADGGNRHGGLWSEGGGKGTEDGGAGGSR